MTGGRINSTADNSILQPDSSSPTSPLWIFGYGSLIWKTNFPYEDKVIGRVDGYARKFWLGDVEHRGAPGAPARVATLIEKEKESTWGVAFKVNPSHIRSTISYLNTREKGYSMKEVTFSPCQSRRRDMPSMTIVAYIGTETSPKYLGPESLDKIARQIVSTRGCSGSNSEYVLNIASSMREIAPEVEDEHLFSLEARIKDLLFPPSPAAVEQRLVLRVGRNIVNDVKDDSLRHNRKLTISVL